MHIFYIPEVNGDLASLDAAESGHAFKVLRLREGDPVVLVDGKGNRHEGTIREAHPKKCLVGIERSRQEGTGRNYTIHMAVAPVKSSDRTEWFLEKAVEIGIDMFTPIRCRYGERNHINSGRLEKIAVSAMKQSQKSVLPELAEMTPFEEFVRRPFAGRKLIAHCHPGDRPHMKDLIRPGEEVIVLIGPEGDFSEEEVSLAMENGFAGVSLGNSRLRTETAALVACMTVALMNEEA